MKVLNDRKDTHGDFVAGAALTQEFKRLMEQTPNWETLPDYQKEALHVIVHKFHRILVGDPLFIDNYRDIAGYATLVVDILKREENATDVVNVKTINKAGEWIES